MKLTREEMKERRQRIIMAAFDLFCNKGIEGTSLAEIARKADVGETTIYRYFENKTRLVLEAFIWLWDSIMSNVEHTVQSEEDYESMTGYEQIKVWIRSFRELYISHSDFVLFSYEAKLYLLRRNVKLNRFQQDTLMHAVREPCLDALDKGKTDGSIPVKQDSEDLFYAIWGTVRGYIVKIVIYGRLYGEDSPWEDRYHVMEQGILSALSLGWKPR